MPVLKLTKSATDALKPQGKTVYYYDSILTGFFLRITKAGSRTWGYEYRLGSGRGAPKRRLTLATHGRATARQAREMAEKAAAAVMDGGDPANDRIEKAGEMTFSGLLNLYEAEGCYVLRGARIGEPWKPLSKQYTISRLRNHAEPLIGRKKITDIKMRDIEKMYHDISAGKTAFPKRKGKGRGAKAKGGEGTARKVVRDISAMYTFAIRRELATENPTKYAAVRKTDNRRERYLSLAELETLGAVLREMEAEGVNSKAITIVRLLALTGCRRTEISGLKWSEVDLERGLLILEDTKTGKSMRPLGQAAWDVLKAQENKSNSEYVFPAATGDGPYQGLGKIWKQVRRRADIEDATLHSLRHTVGSTAVSMGESLHLTGAILGHATARSTAIYAHVQTDPLKQAADRVTAKIEDAMSG